MCTKGGLIGDVHRLGVYCNNLELFLVYLHGLCDEGHALGLDMSACNHVLIFGHKTARDCNLIHNYSYV